MNKLVLIDGNSLINRGFYATPPLSTSDGKPVNAVYAFINMLIKIIVEIKPTNILVAFDRKEPTFRHKMYSEYKGTRKPMPEDLRPQIEILKHALDCMGISRYECAGIEADDIIGATAKKFSIPTVIITGDKDSFQLVDETTSVYFTKRGITELEIYDNDNFKEKTGITPKQIVDLKSMMGDSSDNIPGIEGVGEVTALKLVKTYGTLENMYDNIDELTGKLKEKAIKSEEVARLSKVLATIDVSVDIPLSLGDMTYEFPFKQSAKKLFVELEFKTLLKKPELFSEGKTEDKEEKETVKAEVVEIKGASDFPKLVKGDKISVILGENINLYCNNTEYRIKIKNNFFDEGITTEDAVLLLKKIVEDDSLAVVVYSKKDFMYEAEKYGAEIKAHLDDVSIEKHVSDSNASVPFDEFITLADGDKTRPAEFLFNKHLEYQEKLKAENMLSLYTDVELPLADVLYDMERKGFKVDLKMLGELSDKYENIISELLDKIKESAGVDFNPNSPKQLGEVLFDKLKLKSGKKNSRGYSTSAEVLESLENEHEIIPLILKYRQISKLKSTYIDGLKRLVDKESGVVHTTFYQTLTSTGRLSSREPNLQNIPVREEEGRELRKLFISSFANGKIVGADYSQIELRLLAHFSKCEKLIKAYIGGTDIHSLTASQVFGVPIEEVTSSMRRSAKAVNFGIIYGISDFGLSKQLKIPVKRAKEYIEKYFETYKGVKEYMDKNVEFAKEHGYVTTLLGRKRYIKEINSPNYNLRSFGERAAMNMPLQGTAADVIKLAMIKVHNRLNLEKLKSKMILQVHDELLIDTAPEEVETVKKILVEEMQSAVKLEVPLIAEAECGTRWFDAK